MKMPSVFIARAALCALIIALCPQAQNAGTTRASLVLRAGGPRVILCGPGLVYRCTPQGCFCVRP